jgi:hypothetical protein
MRSIVAAAVMVAAAGIALAGCGSSGKPAATSTASAKPKISAATACSDFSHWYLSLDGHVGTTKNLSTLQNAVSAAPSGQLYQDLSTLESDVTTSAAASGSLQSAETDMTITAAAAVEQDCQAVNPAS